MNYYYRNIAIDIGITKTEISSVGKPKDGNPHGDYILLHINESSSIYTKDSILVDFMRFDYDIETAARTVEYSPLPNAYAESFRRLSIHLKWNL